MRFVWLVYFEKLPPPPSSGSQLGLRQTLVLFVSHAGLPLLPLTYFGQSIQAKVTMRVCERVFASFAPPFHLVSSRLVVVVVAALV